MIDRANARVGANLHVRATCFGRNHQNGGPRKFLADDRPGRRPEQTTTIPQDNARAAGAFVLRLQVARVCASACRLRAGRIGAAVSREGHPGWRGRRVATARKEVEGGQEEGRKRTINSAGWAGGHKRCPTTQRRTAWPATPRITMSMRSTTRGPASTTPRLRSLLTLFAPLGARSRGPRGGPAPVQRRMRRRTRQRRPLPLPMAAAGRIAPTRRLEPHRSPWQTWLVPFQSALVEQ
jgi:hypothetical protein